MTPSSFDYAALSQKFTAKEKIQQLGLLSPKKWLQSADGTTNAWLVILIAIIAIPVIGLFMLILVIPLMLFIVEPSLGKGIVTLLPIATFWGIWAWMAHDATQQLRFKHFAAANHFGFLERKNGGHQGMLFNLGHSRQFDPGFQLSNPARTSFGNYQWVTGSGKNRTTHVQGFVCIRLSRNLPHVILDATSNNFMKQFSSLAVGLSSDQRIDLEGDFDKFFTVYCPNGYGRDTLYWLTPELMEILKNKLPNYDIEIVDNQVYLYPGRRFVFDPATIENIVNTADWLHQEFEQNTHRYSDERINSFAANTVAAPGKRLKRSIRWWTAVFVIIYIIVRFIMLKG